VGPRHSTRPDPASANNNHLIDKFIEQLSTYSSTDLAATAGGVEFSQTYNSIKDEFTAAIPGGLSQTAGLPGGRGAALPGAVARGARGRSQGGMGQGGMGQGGMAASLTGGGGKEGFGDLYHVLSIAFLLMEEERETFQKQLGEVEDFFVKRAKYAGLLSLQSMARKMMYRAK
jgi:hypothetical protein